MSNEVINKLKKGNGYIFTAYHKPFKLLDEDFIVPVHAGRTCAEERKDDAADADSDFLSKLIGDDTGDSISARNNEFSECTVLYWMWKNLPLQDYKYIGLFQYRRQLILNEVFDNAKDDTEKKAYKCVHFKNVSSNFGKTIGLTDDRITELLSEYDCILPYSSDLGVLGISSPYEDWVRRIPGVHVDDLVELERLMKQKHPELADAFGRYLNAPYKRMYQIFIARPEIVENYCAWMFDILFEADKYADTSLYTVNGRRTLGYLAEILYGFYFTYMQDIGAIKAKECGVTFLE